MMETSLYNRFHRGKVRDMYDLGDRLLIVDADREVRDHLSAAELDELFDYSYYTRYVDESFRRLGLA